MNESKHMKNRIVAISFILAILLLAGIMLYYTNPRWTPWYCSQYSGFRSYAWGALNTHCENAGCVVRKTEELVNPPGGFDMAGFKFQCVRQ